MRIIRAKNDITLRQNERFVAFFVEELLGQGASCVAYKVTYEESDGIKHNGVLKEYCPSYLEEYGEVRNPDGSLVIPANLSEQFAAELNKFKNTYRVINEYIVSNPEAANYHPVQLGLFEGNNTLYTLASCDYGQSYDKLSDKNLKSLLNLILSVTKGVEQYHKAGFLHLDIKPENIFILDNVTDLVKLFDYDSLTSIEEVRARKVKSIPCPGVFYVPELNQRNFRSIGIATDIFEIGAMLFLRLFGRSPEPKDTAHNAEYAFEKAELLQGVSPKVLFELETLFKNTLQTSALKRYQTTVDLKQQLEKIISLVDSKKPYLLNMPKWQPTENYVGRGIEIAEIHRRLQTDGYVFVKGIGGLGKSELAKIYAKEYADNYHTVVFCKFTDSLTGLVASLPIQGINTDDYNDFDKLVKDKNQALHDCDAHTLIIVDNFNVTYDKFIRDFLPAGNDGFKVIFTTRCTQAAEYYESKTYELPKLSFENCERLFYSKANLTQREQDDDTVPRIITAVDRNTLVLVLFASAIKRTHMSVSEALSRLEKQQLDAIAPKIFHEYDYDTDETEAYNKLLAHLYAVFSISGLNGAEMEVLKDMTLISGDGILIDEFVEFCKSSSVNQKTVEGLIDQSWLFISNDTVVTMHPTVSDLIAGNDRIQKQQSYRNLAEVLEEYCNPDYVNHFSVVLSRLSAAVQLDRRYISENLDKRLMMKAKLGRLYANAYRPDEARKYLLESEQMTVGTKYVYFLPYIYSFLGDLEKDFGTLSSAIQYYQKSVDYARKPLIRYHEIACESMIDIGDCYATNRQYNEAYKVLVDALRYARFHHFPDKIGDAAKLLISVCNELNLLDKAQKYNSIFEKYKSYAGYDSEEMISMENLWDSGKGGSITDFLKNYNAFLEEKKREFGEDSPLYKDLAQAKWMTYVVSGDKETAVRMAQEDLDFVAKTYGKVSMEMADRLCTIASVFPALAEFEYAEHAARQASEICEKLGQKSSYTYFQSKLCLAECYIPQKRSEEARQAICDLDLTVFTGNDTLSDIISSAGFVFCELSMGEKIEPLCLDLLKRENTEIIGQIDANMILCVVNEERGNLEAAERFAETAKNILEKINDDYLKKQFYMHYYRAKARIAFRKGDNKKAVQIMLEFLSFYTEEERMMFAFYAVYTELGLYYTNIGDAKNAEKMYTAAEKILKHNHMPNETYVVLYNNIAYQMINSAQFDEAKKYLDKIVTIQPSIVKPKTYLDGVICGNIAWTEFALGHVDSAMQIAQEGIRCQKKLGANNTREYITALYNYGLMLVSKGKHKDVTVFMKEVIDAMGGNPNLVDIKVRSEAVNQYIYALLMTDKTEEAYQYAKTQSEYYSELYKDDVEKRCEAILGIGLAFASAGYRDCMEFYSIVKELLEDTDKTDSIVYARLMNYAGVYFFEFEKDTDTASGCLRDAKAILEDLNAVEDDLYKLVNDNIKYIEKEKQKNFDELIRKMAESLNDTDDDTD